MHDKLAMILSSGDPKVLEIGLMYALNAINNGWMNDVQLYLFGPAEVAIATDPELQEAVRRIIAAGTIPMACKWCSDRYNASELLAGLGCAVDYVGEPISHAIHAGYVPLMW